MNTYIRVDAKRSELNFNLLLFSNRREQVLKIRPKFSYFPNTFQDLLPAIGEQHYIEMYFQQFYIDSEICDHPNAEKRS